MGGGLEPTLPPATFGSPAGDASRVTRAGFVELRPDSACHLLCVVVRGRQWRLLRQVLHASKSPLVLFGHQPEVKVRGALHQRQEVDMLGPGGRLDRRDQPVQDRPGAGLLRDW